MQAAPGASLNDDEPVTEADRMPPQRRIRLFVTVALLVYAIDVVSKVVAVATLDAQPRPLVGELLQLRLTRNPGAAFSLGTGSTTLLAVVALAVVIAVIWLARRVVDPVWAVALGLLVGGATGNLTDRIFREPGPMRGHVVDFLELPHWPVFNLGDSAIVLAAGLILLQSLRGIHLDGTRARG